MTTIESIEIVDAQIHEPFPGVSLTEEQKPLLSMIQVELAREALEATGVDQALAVTDDKFIEFAHQRYPGRFPGVHTFPHTTPDLASEVRRVRTHPAMVAGRALVANWVDATIRSEFEAGAFDPIYEAAEEVGLPIFNSTHGQCAKMAGDRRAASEVDADHRSHRRGTTSGVAAGHDELAELAGSARARALSERRGEALRRPTALQPAIPIRRRLAVPRKAIRGHSASIA